MIILQNIGIISVGASVGAILRYGISLALNDLFKSFAFGTLMTNYLGCFLMGLFLAIFANYPNISPQWRVFLVTGFLGSLTTFSSFSGEVYEYFDNGKWLNALQVIGLHIIGGLICIAIGFFSWKLLSSFN